MNLRVADQILKRPLQFGNYEQIQAVKAIRAHYEEKEPGKYRVQVEISGSHTVVVEAESEEEARKMATCDWEDEVEIDIRNIEKLGGEEDESVSSPSPGVSRARLED